MVNQVSSELGIAPSPMGGWLTGLLKEFQLDSDVSIGVCFPYDRKVISGVTKKGVSYYSFIQGRNITRYNKEEADQLLQIINDFNPDILHVFGTEFSHSLAAIMAFSKADRTVIHIQGLCSVSALHYFQGLPLRVQYGSTLRDFIRRDNVFQQKKKFEKRGLLEIKAIQCANHIVGRTEWDYACTNFINPAAHYYLCNETLRDAFYTEKWDIQKCQKHTIFISQSHYPIKGFHIFIEALIMLAEKFPDVKVYTTGKDYVHHVGFKDKLKLTAYQRYIRKRLKKHHLEDKIIFLGTLNEYDMRDQYLKSHVFVLPSTIENSPNSLGEAMILGLPIVASNVGGNKDMMVHGKEGFLYPVDEPYMLAYYIAKLFEEEALCEKFSVAAQRHARITHDPFANKKQLTSIYRSIVNCE